MRRPLRDSHEHVVVDLLKVVRDNNLKLREFLLFLGLRGDTWKDLNQEFWKAVDETKQEIQGLNINIR